MSFWRRNKKNDDKKDQLKTEESLDSPTSPSESPNIEKDGLDPVITDYGVLLSVVFSYGIPSPVRSISSSCWSGGEIAEGHTRLFLVLAALTIYPDDSLCAFYDTSFKIPCRALLSEADPRENFAAFVEQTQYPAHHLPAARSACPRPPLMESRSPPQPMSHHGATGLRIAVEPVLLMT
ncbi:hypothetical protein cypCar_00019499 [Cyprinus carpio]|nr:hypothetical protein cypCar_00019499 [Cyprinus carpio]